MTTTKARMPRAPLADLSIDGLRFGTGQCMCARCGATFSSLSGFDRHWTHPKVEGKRNPTPATCRPPAECGLVQNERGMWQSPGPDEPIWPTKEEA